MYVPSFKGNLNTVQSSHNFLCVAIYVSNFQVATKDSTHITFSWDIVDGYYTSSYINYFYLHYQRSNTRRCDPF